MRKDAPFAVDVPGPEKDGPGWVKVGVIAAIGFVIGIAWPRLMGVKLGPSAPGESAAAAASAKASAGRAAEAPPASVAAKAAAGAQPPISATTPTVGAASAGASGPSAGAGAASAAAGAPQVSVQKGAVLSCKTSDGETKKGKECGAVAGLDQLVAPRLRKVATCTAAEGQTGKLSFMVTADFSGSRLSWDIGKSSTVGNLDGITSCLKTHFQGVGTNGVAHEHARYTVAYTATFAPSLEAAAPGTKDGKDAKEKLGDEPKRGAGAGAGVADDRNAKESSDKPDLAAAGEATVGWDVALVRDVPKTGGVVARLPRGTKVKLGASKDGWYAIKYGDGFASEGWVYRSALGR